MVDLPGASGRDRLLLFAGLAGCCLVYLGVYHHPGLAPLGPLRNLAATLLATLPYLLALAAAERVERPSWVELVLLFGGLVVLRLCLPMGLVEGSDDAFRYIWDGRVQHHGINPFAHAPDAPALASLREPLFHPRIYRPDMRTVYPPLAQLWFHLAHDLTPRSLAGFKLVSLAHDAASVYLLWRLLQRAGAPPLRALGYAWSPLAVVQLFGGAHLDGLLVPWLLAALLLAERRPALAGAALGAAAMVRPLAALCGPALALRRPPREGGRALLGFVLACGALILPFARAGRGLVESLMVYGRHWHFNSSLFRSFEPLVGWHLSRPVAYGTVALGSVGIGWLKLGRPARFLAAYALYLALAPTVYPWYLIPVAALGSLFGGPLFAALPALVTASDLVFARPTGAPWRVPATALVIEYTVLYGLLVTQIYRWWRVNAGGADDGDIPRSG